MPKPRSIHTKFLAIALVTISCSQTYAMPEDYESEASALVSSAELNVFYGTFPRDKGDKFKVLTSVRTESNRNYFLISRELNGTPKEFLVVKTYPGGVDLVGKSTMNTFKKGEIPPLEKPLPVKVALAFFLDCSVPASAK